MINWYSLQPKTGVSGNDGGSTSANGTDRGGLRQIFHDELNDLTITSDTTVNITTSEAGANTNDTVMQPAEQQPTHGAAEPLACIEYENERSKYSNNDPCLTAAVRAVRNKLQKYFYYPKKTVAMHARPNGASHKHAMADGHDMPNWMTSYHFSTLFRGQKPCDLIYNRAPCVLLLRRRRCLTRCKRCSRSIRLVGLRTVRRKISGSMLVNQKCVLDRSVLNRHNYCSCCKKWIRSQMRRNRNKTKSNAPHSSIISSVSAAAQHSTHPLPPKSNVSSHCQSVVDNKQPCHSNTFSDANSRLAKKLRMLGTTLSYERYQCRRMEVQQMQENEQRLPSTRIDDSPRLPTPPNEPSVPNYSDPRYGDECDPIAASTSNEIVLTFNTVVTEVFPIEFFHSPSSNRPASPGIKASGCKASARNSNTTHIDDIIKYVPKSLTITLA